MNIPGFVRAPWASACFRRQQCQGLLHYGRARLTSSTASNSTRPQARSAGSEGLNVGHSRFLAEAPRGEKWDRGAEWGHEDASRGALERVSEGKGKLLPTSSHLFKLILPLDQVASGTRKPGSGPPTVLLLHPSQPLSHLTRLILASLPAKNSAGDTAISYRSTSSASQTLQWADSTDIGDFVRSAARTASFSIQFGIDADSGHTELEIQVPTFADRTHFLRARLRVLTQRLSEMENLKRACDREARRGARRVAVGGFGILVVYWGAVARLTFWDYGWDVMEPITYLSGLSTVVCGYLWFLYQGREVSYSSVLDRSISARREALYKARGFDIEGYTEMLSETRALRREIGRIAEDYEDEGGESEEEDKGKEEEKKEGGNTEA
ncbi:hypothetical protein BD779DRAFT_1662241 [Infundibulicybe gibba]|nr:hypothetical protein BD779DRAFT_1662241 [Infundibulicybe gibba]